MNKPKHPLANVKLTADEKMQLSNTYPEPALIHAAARLAKSKSSITHPFTYIYKVAALWQQEHNTQKREDPESPHNSLGSFSAPSHYAGPRSIDTYVPPRIHHEDGTCTGKNWQEQDLTLIPIGQLPRHIKNYTIQQLANEIKNWDKIIRYYSKTIDSKTSPDMPIPSYLYQDRLVFAQAKYQELCKEFLLRPQEEQAQAV